MLKCKLFLPILAFSLSFSPVLLPSSIQSTAFAATAYDNLVQNSPQTIQKIEAVDSSLVGTNKIENFVNDFCSMIQSSGPVTEANLRNKFESAAISMMLSSNPDDSQVAGDMIKAFHIDPTSSTFPPDLLPLKDAIKAQLLGGSTLPASSLPGSGGGGATPVPVPVVTPSTPVTVVTDAAQKEPFSDISGHWAQKDIMTLYAKGIVKGSNGKANPDANVTRAEFASFLVQLLDLPTSAKALSFDDVDASAWYYSNLAAAYEAGLMSGYNKEQIGPNDLISREQMATMMANALKYKGVSIANTATVQFKDNDLIHGWALNGVTAANAMGIAKGLRDGTFNPRGFATRAEAMTMMARLLEKL